MDDWCHWCVDRVAVEDTVEVVKVVVEWCMERSAMEEEAFWNQKAFRILNYLIPKPKGLQTNQSIRSHLGFIWASSWCHLGLICVPCWIHLGLILISSVPHLGVIWISNNKVVMEMTVMMMMMVIMMMVMMRMVLVVRVVICPPLHSFKISPRTKYVCTR